MTFNELEMLKYIQSILKDEFSKSVWYKKFGSKDMVFVEENSGEATSFPITYIEILNPKQLRNTGDSSRQEIYTIFDFEIAQYNQNVGKLSKRDLGIAINGATKAILQEKVNATIETNALVPSEDETIYRRVISGSATYNNKTQMFYK